MVIEIWLLIAIVNGMSYQVDFASHCACQMRADQLVADGIRAECRRSTRVI
jgi:hypothetical protein